MMQSQISKKIAYISVLISLALIFSYIEALIPIDFGIPGVKLGLANVVSIITLYIFGFYYALFVTLIRVVLSGLLFGNMFSIIYSLSGGLISLIIMYLLKETNKFSIVGVSIGGGVFHNVGQLLIAVLIIEQLKLYFYLPILIISGVLMGTLIGIVSMAVTKRVETYVRL